MSNITKWKCSISGSVSVTQRSPVVIGKILLATFNHGQGSNFQGSLCAIDIDNGKELWRFNVNHFLNEPNISNDEAIFITCFDGCVYKIGIDGKQLWKSQPSTRNLWSGIVVGDKFYYAEIAGGSEYTRALNVNDGVVVWEYLNGGHSYALASDFNHYIVHSSVAGSFDQKVISLQCLHKDTGEVMWKTKHDHYLFQPLIIGNQVYIGSRGHIALFDLGSGKLLATHNIDKGVAVTARPIKLKNGVVYITEQGRIFCLDIFEGNKNFEELWNLDLHSQIKARVVLNGSDLLIITENGNLIKVNSETGVISSEEKLENFKEGFGLVPYEKDLIISVSRDCVRLENKI